MKTIPDIERNRRTPDDGAPPTDPGRLSARMILALSGLTVALHVPALAFRLFNSDEASLASIAMVLNRGGRLYHQTADRKPPVVPYLYSAVFRVTGNTDIRPVRVLAVVALAATACLLAAEAGRRYRSRHAALACGVLFSLGVVTFFPPDTQAAGFEIFMLLPMTAAVIAAGRGRAVQAGLWLALACLCKQTALATALPVAYLLVRTRGWRSCLRAAAAGGALILATALFFGPGRFLLWTVTGNGGYLALRGSVMATVRRGLVMTGSFVGLNVALAGLCAWAAARRRAGADLWLWLLSGFVGVVAGARFFGHYYLQLYPPLALIATAAVVGLSPRARRAMLALAVAMATATAAAAGLFPPTERGVLPYGALAAKVRSLTRPNDRIFIWGQYPELYWASRREPATRFIQTGFITGNSGGRPAAGATTEEGIPGAWSMLDADFATRPPDLVIDTSPARIRGSQYYPLSTSRLWPTIQTRYRLVATLDRVAFYRRIP